MHRRSGQATTEAVVLIAVLAVALAAVAWALVPGFEDGVQGLSDDAGALLNGPTGGSRNKR